jgi:type II secretory pathway component GspD/PulD (secretin)
MKPGRVLGKPAPCKPTPDDEAVKLDFDHATVRELAIEVGRVLCKNFVVEPGLAHQPIYVLSAQEIRASALWPTFLSILAANDLTVVDRSGMFAIIAAVDATREAVPGFGPTDPVPTEDRMISKVFDVKGRDLMVVTNYLNIFKSGKGQIHPFPNSGLMLVTDFGSSVARLEWILSQLGKTDPKTR